MRYLLRLLESDEMSEKKGLTLTKNPDATTDRALWSWGQRPDDVPLWIVAAADAVAEQCRFEPAHTADALGYAFDREQDRAEGLGIDPEDWERSLISGLTRCLTECGLWNDGGLVRFGSSDVLLDLDERRDQALSTLKLLSAAANSAHRAVGEITGVAQGRMERDDPDGGREAAVEALAVEMIANPQPFRGEFQFNIPDHSGTRIAAVDGKAVFKVDQDGTLRFKLTINPPIEGEPS